jgi:hypothetical protein
MTPDLSRCCSDPYRRLSSRASIHDRRRQTFDRHAAYVVVAVVAGG